MRVKMTWPLAIGLLIGVGPVSRAQSASMAFVDVTVIAMDAEELLAHQTVVTRDGMIVAVGPANAVSVPMGRRPSTVAIATSLRGSWICTRISCGHRIRAKGRT